MVYCGKPSRGCGCCKKRRIKCDETRPSCRQCSKSGRSCPGYPDEFDLIFRSENPGIKRKRKGAASRKTRESSPKGSPETAEELSQTVISTSDSASPPDADSSLDKLPLTRSRTSSSPLNLDHLLPAGQSDFDIDFSELDIALDLPWNDLLASVVSSPSSGISLAPETSATAFFFRNFVTLPNQAGSMRGYMEHIVSMYNNSSPTSAIQHATHAVALSTLAHYPGNTCLWDYAADSYSKALQEVANAMADPVSAVSDETISSVLMFSLYERSLMGQKDATKPSPMDEKDAAKSWISHVDGAVTLTRLRGPNQFNTRRAWDIFRSVRASILISSIQQGIPMPDLPNPTGFFPMKYEEENTDERFRKICLKLPDLRATAGRVLALPKIPRNEPQMRDHMEAAQDLDAEFETWALGLKEPWGYKTVEVVRTTPDDVMQADKWPGQIYSYDSVFIADITNDYRLCRLFCNCIIAECCDWLSSLGHNQRLDFVKSRNMYIIQQMVDELCGTVPFMVQYHMQNRSMWTGQDKAAAEAIGSYFLAWPLFICMKAPGLPELQRDWLRGRLRFIAEEYGIGQARVFADAPDDRLKAVPTGHNIYPVACWGI